MSTSIVWFRKSLRLHDNPVLTEAYEDSRIEKIIPLFILDPNIVGKDYEKLGASRLRFLIESLQDLDSQLSSKYGSRLILLQGDPLSLFEKIQQSLGQVFNSLLCEYGSEPYEREKFSAICQSLEGKNKDIRIKSFSAIQTILDIEKTISSTSFKNPKSMKDIEKIFATNFSYNEQGFFQIDDPIPEPKNFKPLPTLPFTNTVDESQSLYPLSIEDVIDQISSKINSNIFSVKSYFPGGEIEALARLKRKVSGKIDFVNNFRKPKTMSTNEASEPMEPSTTGLSAYISNGCLSVRKLWKECEKSYSQAEHTNPPESLHGQLLFREMFYLLSRSVENWDDDTGNIMCKSIDWGVCDSKKMTAWEEGKTGFPYIDALMRQLNTTGWMHHLGRHAVSCFLTRGQLWQHWRLGRSIFDQKLIDSDWALNNGNWLWLSGVAPFSMPYFRLYNPCPDQKSSLNVETKTAEFIKFWVPELKNFPAQYIYEPHLAPDSVQTSCNCLIGVDYPSPIVDRKTSAKENLAKFKASLGKKVSI